jgi:tetrapyrrole methylase family protein/MazG family protein
VSEPEASEEAEGPAEARPRVVVVGLGPAGADLLTAETERWLSAGHLVVLRTRRHPAAEAFPEAESLDHCYEEAGSFDELYGRIADEVVARARTRGTVVYAVPGSPAVAERSVALLRGRGDVEVTVLPALSFADLAWARLGVDPMEAGASLVDAAAFAHGAAGRRGPFLVVQCHDREALSAVKLGVEEPTPDHAVLLHHLGLPDEVVREVPWADLDRVVEPDHLTSLWVPEGVRTPERPVGELWEVVAVLRERCPWDRRQTHQSLVRHLLEEAYEAADAIAGLDGSAASVDHLAEELGDVLLQVFFHARLAEEKGWFGLSEVATGVREKLVARHPHVFGDEVAETAEAVLANWERRKLAEKGRASLMDGIPSALPALELAGKLQRKAATVGLDFSDAERALAKVQEELAELGAAEDESERLAEAGDVLFSVVNVLRHAGIDAEAALRCACRRFERRFRAVEVAAAASGDQLGALDAGALDQLWERAKADERSRGAERNRGAGDGGRAVVGDQH